MTHGEFRYWQALYEIDPFGENRADWRAGIEAMLPVEFIFDHDNPGLLDADEDDITEQNRAALAALTGPK